MKKIKFVTQSQIGEHLLQDNDVERLIEARMKAEIWQYVSLVVHSLIDNPIRGVATRKKIAAAGISSVIYKLSRAPILNVSAGDKFVTCHISLDFEYLGVRQGDTFINYHGDRFPVYALRLPCTEIMFNKCLLTPPL